eukprot:tig00020824_g14276.t1
MCLALFTGSRASSPNGAGVDRARAPEILERRGENVSVFTRRDGPAAAAVERLKSLWRYDALEVGGHVQTVCASLFRRPPEGLHYARREMRAEDGGLFALDFAVSSPGAPPESIPDPATPVLLLIPGLTGGSRDRYLMHLAAGALRGGFRPVALCHRGSSGLPLTTARFYSASATGDLRQAVGCLRELYPAAPLFAAGWSLGANLLVRYLGEEAGACPLAGAASLANPFDLAACAEAFRTGTVHRHVYDPQLTSAMRRMFLKNRALFEQSREPSYDVPRALKSKTIAEWDAAITVPCFGWRDAAHYYAEASSKLSLPRVAVPLLCVNAADDPIAVPGAIPYDSLAGNGRVAIAVTRYGGHNGWQAAGEPLGAPWTDGPVIEFFRSLLLGAGASAAGPEP